MFIHTYELGEEQRRPLRRSDQKTALLPVPKNPENPDNRCAENYSQRPMFFIGSKSYGKQMSKTVKLVEQTRWLVQ